MRIISEEVRCIPAFFVKMSGLFWPVLGMIPNIKQRRDAVSRGKPSRRKAARLFN